MLVVFVGGGSFRTLPIVRAALRTPQVFSPGGIRLVDLNLARAETVGRMIQKTPEYLANPCAISWGTDLDRALDGADAVSVTMPVGSPEVCRLSDQASMARGFISSDQLSVSGAFRSLTGGAVLLDIARRMERRCPTALLVNFVNPVAVYSGMVNNHTRVRALGICGGFANHRWDLTRLVGSDSYRDDYDVDVAGVNHLSFILRGKIISTETDIYKVLQRQLHPRWKPPRIVTYPHMAAHITYALERLMEMLRRFNCLLFSTEGDGMAHLFYEEMFERARRSFRPATRARIRADARRQRLAREKADREFAAHLKKDLDDGFWNALPHQRPWFAANDADVTVPILKAMAGVSREKIAASRPGYGAVRGFKERTVLEYSLWVDKRGIRAVPDLEVPDRFHGLISALATHQTLLGDAVVSGDPRTFADALYAYPVHQNTRQAKALFRDLLTIHRTEISEAFQKARDYC
jgi:alpha-galactosidase/6-phospho-beta-glucosidase family protein